MNELDLITDDERRALVPEAPHGGVHTGERLDPAKVSAIRALYTSGASKHAIAEQVGCTWKTVDAICDPERSVTPNQADEVRRLRETGMDFIDIATTLKMELRKVRLIAQSDAQIITKLQESRAARALVLEAVSMEASHQALETRLKSGKLTVAEAANLTMIANGMVRDTVGAAPIRVRLEADEHVMAAMSLFGGGAAKPVPAKTEVIDAEVIPSPLKETTP
jgi:plasmid maintenance system antidote protein VapI